MNKREVILLLALSVIISVGLSVASAQVKLVHVHWSGAANDPGFKNVENMARKFEKLHPEVSIEIVPIIGNPGETILVRILSGLQWDTVNFMPHQGLKFYKEGVLLDLAEYIERDFIAEGVSFLPGTIEPFTYDSEIWGLPTGMLIQAFGYNKTLFDEAGQITPNRLKPDQWTWEEARSIANKMTQDSNADGTIDIWGIDMNTSGTPSLLMFGPIVDQAGGLLFDRRIDPTQANFLAPEVREAADYYLSFWVDGFAPYRSTPYFSGQSAMTPYDVPRHVDFWPGRGVDHEFGLTFQPKGPARGGAHVTSWGLQMSSTSPNQDLAWEWLKFLGFGQTPLFGTPASGEIRMDSIPPVEQLLMDWLTYADVLEEQKQQVIPVVMDPDNRSRYVDSTSDYVNGLINKYFGQVIQGELSPINALEALQQEVTIMLDN
jgi:ABC-type glycerol-3-phosphate transport system substrate-binding protein